MKPFIRMLGFLLALSLALVKWDSIFSFKYGDGIYDLTSFYEQKEESVDVLILGSSHAFEDFNTGILWDEYGMASYILAGSIQPLWNSYYYFKEALKTQKPKMIVLEAYGTVFPTEYSDDSRIIKNNYGLHWSKNKIDSLCVSAPKERWKEFFLEYTQYHNRYKELGCEDFLVFQGNSLYRDWKGFGCNMSTVPMDSVDIRDVTSRSDLSPKNETYYRKIIELAQSNSIPIIVVVSPYAGINVEEQEIFNKASDIAEEYGVPFLNCNLILDEMGIDYSCDAADVAHLNYRGNRKFSRYIGQYILDNCSVPDRRGNDIYTSWENHARYIRQMEYDQELLDLDNADELLNKLQNENYYVFISMDDPDGMIEPEIWEIFNCFGINKNEDSRVFFCYRDSVVWKDSEREPEYYLDCFNHNIQIKRGDYNKNDDMNHIVIDKIDYLTVSNGINIVVYDILTEKVADSFAICMDNGSSIVRQNRE